jgi:nitroreductase
VPPELINQILRAATAAPPASNMYGWRFLVIRDQTIKNAVADRYRRLWYDEDGGPAFRKAAPSRVRYQQMLDACDYQADHLHEAPVWIVPCQLGHTRTVSELDSDRSGTAHHRGEAPTQESGAYRGELANMKPKRAGADRPSVHGVSTRSVDDLVRAIGEALPKAQAPFA